MNNTRIKVRSTKDEVQRTKYEVKSTKDEVQRTKDEGRSSLCLKIRLIIICMVFSVTGVCQQASFTVPACLSIRFTATDGTFPSRWYNKKIHAEAESLTGSEIENVNAALNVTFSKYPEKILCTCLSSVYVLKSMKFYGVPYGGTSYGRTVYITDDDENLTCSYDLLENYFHHEFSSILLHKNSCKFEKRKWKRINPEGFRYGKGGLQAILSSTADMSYDPELNERGFLTRYSEASLEEDFNVYCQNVFNGGNSFWHLADKYPKIKAKTELVIQFYHRIDPVFTENYFRKVNPY